MRTPGLTSAIVAAGLVAVAAVTPLQAKPGFYLSVAEFLETVFDNHPGDASRLIVDSRLRDEIEAVLDHSFPRIRMRYWEHDDTTAWVLDEIGKTEPITIGVAVEGGRVKSVRVLEFRESRGFEIRYPFFTEQFEGVGIDHAHELDRSIDGITGATMSVNAVDRVVRAALLLDARVREGRGS